MSESQKLPDTCPVSSQQVSQAELSQQARPWGYLFPNKPRIKYLELKNEQYLIGRLPTCDLVLGEEIDSKVRSQFSKEHFRVRRAPLSANSDLQVVYIDDLSFNGTFVNNKKLGRGHSIILRNNDKISLAVTSFDAFIYMDKDGDLEVRNYPQEVRERYSIGDKLGNGAYGQVRRAFDKTTGCGYAIKIIQKNRNLQMTRFDAQPPVRIHREICILKRVQHNFVIKFSDVFDFTDTVFIVMELVRGGELFNIVQKRALKENEAKYYFYQLALAIRYLHRRGIIHRDIKLENILLTTDSPPMIKLADFGLSNFVDTESMLKTYCGTPMYIAPEVLASQGRAASYDTQADVWSMGIVLYMCLSGISPFVANDPNMPLNKQIDAGYYSFPRRYWRYVSHTAKDLVKKMLVVDPARRITIDRILDHPWVQDAKIKTQVGQMLREHELSGKENIIVEEVEDIDDYDAVRKAKRVKLLESDTSSPISSLS